MSIYTYVGILESAFAADKFMTSIFSDGEGNYYTQEDADEIIVKFKPLKVTRGLKRPKEHQKIDVNVGDRFVYSFHTTSNELIFGSRDTIEEPLLGFLNAEYMTAHARLLISSFLKLYQKTIDLVNESNKDLEKKGIEQKLDSKIAFLNSSEPQSSADEIIAAIRKRYNHFNSINQNIRLEDIAFMNHEKAFFSNHHIRLDLFANRHSLQNDESDKLVSELIMICAEKNKGVIRTLLMKRTETSDFILGTQYITVDQNEADAPLFEQENVRTMPRSLSVIETFIRIDKEIYDQNTTKKKKKKAVDEKALWSNFEAIVKRNFRKLI